MAKLQVYNLLFPSYILVTAAFLHSYSSFELMQLNRQGQSTGKCFLIIYTNFVPSPPCPSQTNTDRQTERHRQRYTDTYRQIQTDRGKVGGWEQFFIQMELKRIDTKVGERN